MKKCHIIALIGGGFSMAPDNPLLDRSIIECSGKRAPAYALFPLLGRDQEGCSVALPGKNPVIFLIGEETPYFD